MGGEGEDGQGCSGSKKYHNPSGQWLCATLKMGESFCESAADSLCAQMRASQGVDAP